MRSSLRLLLLSFLRPTRTYDPTMESNAFSCLGNKATGGLRDMRRMETENESERPNEHPDWKLHDLFPVSNTSHTYSLLHKYFNKFYFIALSYLFHDSTWQYFFASLDCFDFRFQDLIENGHVLRECGLTDHICPGWPGTIIGAGTGEAPLQTKQLLPQQNYWGASNRLHPVPQFFSVTYS